MGALIRQQFGVNPWNLTENEFADLSTEAIFLKKFDKEQTKTALAEVLALAFGA